MVVYETFVDGQVVNANCLSGITAILFPKFL